MLAFRGDHYMTGNNFGIESKAIRPENMLWYIADLDTRGYPFDRIGIQYSGYLTDNAPPSTAACELVKQWNAKYEYPKLRLALASEFPEYAEKNLHLCFLFIETPGSTGGPMAMVQRLAKLLRLEKHRT